MSTENDTDNHVNADNRDSYFVRHWQGNLDLVTSYWINYLFFSLVIMLLTLLISIFSNKIDNTLLALTVPVAWNIFVFFVFTPWVLVGLLRSASRHIAMHNIHFWANVVRVLVIVIAYRSLTTFQNSTYPQIVAYYELLTGTGTIPNYIVGLDNNETTLSIVGGINLGIADKVMNLVINHPNIKTIHIESIGGLTREARRIATIINDNSFDTFVNGYCFSSCTYIFISGKERTLSDHAKLGFHRPTVAGVDAESMDRYIIKDKKIFEEKGVAPDFINKIFNTPNTELLQVSTEELTKAGVVTNVISYPSNYWGKNKKELEILLQLSGIQQNVLEQNNSSSMRVIYADIIKSLPAKYDEITSLDKVIIAENAMKYEYTILTNDLVFNSEKLSTAINKSIFSEVCNDIISVYFLKRGVTFSFHYLDDKDKSTIFTVEIKDCSNATNKEL